jgi:S1-C subfamily serine protease
MNNLNTYSILYPRIPIEIILFFSELEYHDKKVKHKSVIEFCEYFTKKYQTAEFIQPRIISSICDSLVISGNLSLISRSGVENLASCYISFLKNENIRTDLALQEVTNHLLCCKIYGFPFIYRAYKDFVLPIEHTDNNDSVSLGTCFLFNGGIVSAKHCFEQAKKISIKGIAKENLKEASFVIHKNGLMDLIFIKFSNDIGNTIQLDDEANVLDEVITLGFPKVAGYHNFMSAEKATISARFTATTGQVAASAEDIWIKERLFLITARIQGGNSGGPVINKDGKVVGVSVNISKGEGDYDDLGYGTVIPIFYLKNEIINNRFSTLLDASKIEFEDFI